jgi:hypothetical protein
MNSTKVSTLSVRLDLWGNEIPNEAPALLAKKSRKPVQQKFDRDPTDIVTWLRKNRPATAASLKQLRTALNQRQDCGAYTIQSAGESYTGEQRLRLNGPNGTVLIVSEKARHFLLGKLRRLRKLQDA